MKQISKIILFILCISLSLNASNKLYNTIEKMNKGIDGYIVGKVLNKVQEKLLNKNAVASNNKNILKFLANDDLMIVINKKNNKVLAINKRYTNISQKEVKKMISKFIFKFDEPTAMAHNKMVYWIYDKDGNKLSSDDLKNFKNDLKIRNSNMTLAKAINLKDKKTKKFNPYLSFKMNSSEAIMTKEKKTKASNINILISSNVLIKDATGMVALK